MANSLAPLPKANPAHASSSRTIAGGMNSPANAVKCCGTNARKAGVRRVWSGTNRVLASETALAQRSCIPGQLGPGLLPAPLLLARAPRSALRRRPDEATFRYRSPNLRVGGFRRFADLLPAPARFMPLRLGAPVVWYPKGKSELRFNRPSDNIGMGRFSRRSQALRLRRDSRRSRNPLSLMKPSASF